MPVKKNFKLIIHCLVLQHQTVFSVLPHDNVVLNLVFLFKDILHLQLENVQCGVNLSLFINLSFDIIIFTTLKFIALFGQVYF